MSISKSTVAIVVLVILLAFTLVLMGWYVEKTKTLLQNEQKNHNIYLKDAVRGYSSLELRGFLKCSDGMANGKDIVVDCARSPNTGGTINHSIGSSSVSSCQLLKTRLNEYFESQSVDFKLNVDSATVFEFKNENGLQECPYPLILQPVKADQPLPLNSSRVVNIDFNLYQCVIQSVLQD